MIRLDMGTPSAKQAEFLRLHARHRAYGGARGGGKSWIARFVAKLYCAAYPGIRVCLVRHTYDELYNNHLRILRAELQGVCTYNDQRKTITWPNGSTITGSYYAKAADISHFQGVEYDVIILEEATQLTEQMIRDVAASCRGVNNYPKEIIYTCNPGGPGHSYIKRLFVDRKYLPGEDPHDYAFVQSLVQDNKTLMAHDPDYLKFLEALPERRKQAWLYGRWDTYDGQVFDIRDDPKHYKDRLQTHVIAPFQPPANWTYYLSYDYGYNRPFSAGFWTIDHEGTLYRILEIYGCTNEPNVGVRWTADQQFTEIARVMREHPYLKGRRVIGVADPAIWTVDGSGHSIAEHAVRHGIHFRPANNDRINGWQQVQYRLQMDDEGKPRLYVFENCMAFRRTMPLLTYDEHRVEDIDTTQEDHIADETRYMCMEYEIKPLKAPARKVQIYDPLDDEDWRR